MTLVQRKTIEKRSGTGKAGDDPGRIKESLHKSLGGKHLNLQRSKTPNDPYRDATRKRGVCSCRLYAFNPVAVSVLFLFGVPGAGIEPARPFLATGF